MLAVCYLYIRGYQRFQITDVFIGELTFTSAAEPTNLLMLCPNLDFVFARFFDSISQQVHP